MLSDKELQPPSEMNDGQEYLWHVELDYLRAQLRYALNHLDNPTKRDEMKAKIWTVYYGIDELCEQAKEEGV